MGFSVTLLVVEMGKVEAKKSHSERDRGGKNNNKKRIKLLYFNMMYCKKKNEM